MNRHNTSTNREVQPSARIRTYRLRQEDGGTVPIALTYIPERSDRGAAYILAGTTRCISPERVRTLIACGNLIPVTEAQTVESD